jgi:hypothetical protein
MARLTAFMPKIAVFLIATLIGGSIAYVGAAALNRPQLAPTASEAPEFTMTTDTGQLAAFDLIDAPQNATILEGMSEGDLGAAADALLDASPPPGTTPLGFPRVPLVSQFDGGPFQGANCTLAAGAMLARLAFGIVTSGSVLRSLQFDFDGGTDLHDLNTALYRGYGAQIHLGGLSAPKMFDMSLKGWGLVIQGNTSFLNPKVKVAPFKGPHAVYIDGAFAGDADTPPAYYVIDPQGRPNYKGGWWPKDEVEKFAFGFSGTDKIAAAWAFPPGGVPPEVVNPDVPDLPGGEPEEEPDSNASPTPLPSGAGLPEGVEPGDEDEPEQPTLGDPPVLTPVEVADVDLVPFLTACVVVPPPDGCPDGVEAVFDKPPPILHVDLGPDITVVSVDSSSPNVAFVAFRVEGSPPVDVTYWQSDGTPPEIDSASAMVSLPIGGQPTFVARLDVLAGTEYHFQVTAGDGIFTSASPIGTFTTGDGVKTFDVALASVANPSFKIETGVSPYVNLAAGGLATPLFQLGALSPSACDAVIDFGGTDFCQDSSPPPDVGCTQAVVTYELLGIDASGVLVQAFPTETGEAEGSPTLDGILEADGPAGSGEVAVGCLASGLTYTIALDAVGDPVGLLASTQVTVP